MMQKRRVMKLGTLLFVLLSTWLIASQNTDSLKTVLSRSKNDTSKVRTLLTLCRQFGSITIDEKIAYATEALALAKKLNFRKGIISAGNSLGQAYSASGQYDEALKLYDSTIALAVKDGDRLMQANLYEEWELLTSTWGITRQLFPGL